MRLLTTTTMWGEKKISLAKLLFALSSVIYWMYAFDLSKLHLSKRLNGALFFFPSRLTKSYDNSDKLKTDVNCELGEIVALIKFSSSTQVVFNDDHIWVVFLLQIIIFKVVQQTSLNDFFYFIFVSTSTSSNGTAASNFSHFLTRFSLFFFVFTKLDDLLILNGKTFFSWDNQIYRVVCY